MSRLNNLVRQLEGLGEIREIMNSMKTLAYLETRKLSRFMETQAGVVEGIERVAVDLLHFHPSVLPAAPAGGSVYVLFGSERGFCGDFNHAVLRQLERVSQQRGRSPLALLAIGHKLHTLMEVEQREAIEIDGASVADEVPTVLNAIVDHLASVQGQHGVVEVSCLFHEGEAGLVTRPLWPPFGGLAGAPCDLAYPPILNETPETLLLELTDHYLFAALHSALYASLMAENHRRIAHLDGAVKHLDKESEALTHRCNSLRQEEIINEIEVILLSAASLQQPGDGGRDARTVEN